jgi:hypothetical protein
MTENNSTQKQIKDIRASLEKFVWNSLSHSSSDEYFSGIKKDKKDYISIPLSVNYTNKSITPSNSMFESKVNLMYESQIALANEAIGKLCEYVTDIKYPEFKLNEVMVKATGWRKKK